MKNNNLDSKKTLQVLFTIFLVLLVVVITIFLTLQSRGDDEEPSDQDTAFASDELVIPTAPVESCSNELAETFSNGLDTNIWEPFELPGDTNGVYETDGFLTGDNNISILNVSTQNNNRIVRGQNTIQTFSGNFEASVEVQMISPEDDKDVASASWLLAYDDVFNRFGVGIEVDKTRQENEIAKEVVGFAQTSSNIWNAAYTVNTHNEKTYTLTIRRINNITKLYAEFDGKQEHIGTYTNVFTGDVKIALYNIISTNGSVESTVSAFDNFSVDCLDDDSEIRMTTATSCNISNQSDNFASFNNSFWKSHDYLVDPGRLTQRVYKLNDYDIINGELVFDNLSFPKANEIVDNQVNVHGIETLDSFAGDFRASVDINAILDETDLYDVSGVWLVGFNENKFTQRFGVGFGTAGGINNSPAIELLGFAQEDEGPYYSARNVNTNNSIERTLTMERVGDRLVVLFIQDGEVIETNEYEGIYDGTVKLALYTIVSSEQPSNAQVVFDNFELSCPQFESTIEVPAIGAELDSASQALQTCTALDIDGDQTVSITDLANFASFYGKGCIESSSANASPCGSIDSNNDEVVNLQDLANFASKFGLASCI